MRNRTRPIVSVLVSVATVTLAGSPAWAQLLDPPPLPGEPGGPPVPDDDRKSDESDESGEPRDRSSSPAAKEAVPTEGTEPSLTPRVNPYSLPPPRPVEEEPPRPPRNLDFPQVFTTPTGYFLPAGVISGSLGVDTGGGVSGDAAVGLGDVAEFGVATGRPVMVQPCATCDVESLDYYSSAYFKMGLREGLLFGHQPALALGFEKSFERNHDARSTRYAKLQLTASKRLGRRFKLHGGVVFWDAKIESGSSEFQLNDRGIGQQTRGYGAIEIEPLPRSQLLLELDWAPLMELRASGNDGIELRPMFAWGVRYQLAPWGVIESGVRVPDIGDINLIDAQIFGQLRIYSWHFHDLLKRHGR